jgi:hypothetical protein
LRHRLGQRRQRRNVTIYVGAALLMIAGFVAIGARRLGRPIEAATPTYTVAAPTNTELDQQPAGELDCNGDVCTGFDDLPVAPGASDFYIGPESLGEPTIDLSLFETLTRCTTLSPDAKTCTKIEGITRAPLATYAVPSASIDTTTQERKPPLIGIGTVFADISAEKYVSDSVGPSGPSVTVRGHEAVAFSENLDAAVIWQERPGVLTWVSVPAELEPQLLEIAEGIRKIDGPKTIPSKVVVDESYPYDAIDNRGRSLVVGRAGSVECVHVRFLGTCEQEIGQLTVFYAVGEQTRLEVAVGGWTPANVVTVRLANETGTLGSVQTTRFFNYEGRYFDIAMTNGASPTIIEWLDADGAVVSREEHRPMTSSQIEQLSSFPTIWDELSFAEATVATDGPPTS